MEKKYRIRKDTRSGKLYKYEYKSKAKQKHEREIIESWCILNLCETKSFEYIESTTLYAKFIQDTKSDITKKSFGMYLMYFLPKTGIGYKRVDKFSKKGTVCTYFGLGLKNVLPKTQRFYIKERFGYNKFQEAGFTIFNRENLESWILSCLVINSNLDKNKIESYKLFENFCLYHNLILDANQVSLMFWGRFLNKFLLKSYPFIKRKKINIVKNGKKTTRHYYTSIQIKD